MIHQVQNCGFSGGVWSGYLSQTSYVLDCFVACWVKIRGFTSRYVLYTSSSLTPLNGNTKDQSCMIKWSSLTFVWKLIWSNDSDNIFIGIKSLLSALLQTYPRFVLTNHRYRIFSAFVLLIWWARCVCGPNFCSWRTYPQAIPPFRALSVCT